MAEAELRFETPERVSLSLEVAGVGDRAFAWLADLLCLFLLWIAALLLYSISGDLLREWQALSAGGQAVAVLAVLVSGWGWDVLWETLGGGRTPGKRLVGLRVVRADGAPVGLPESVARNVLRAVELPLGYAPGVLMVALSSRRQRLGDLVGGTLVVRDRRYDLSRYADHGDAADDPRFAALRGRAAAALAAGDYDRLLDFLRRRPRLEPAARARIAAVVASALATRAGVPAPGPDDAERFLEAFAEQHAREGARA